VSKTRKNNLLDLVTKTSLKAALFATAPAAKNIAAVL
jgi:hypothetical protein